MVGEVEISFCVYCDPGASSEHFKGVGYQKSFFKSFTKNTSTFFQRECQKIF